DLDRLPYHHAGAIFTTTAVSEIFISSQSLGRRPRHLSISTGRGQQHQQRRQGAAMNDNTPSPEQPAVVKQSWIKVNPPVFIGAGGLCLLFVLFTVAAPKTAETLFAGMQTWVVNTAGWFYILAVALFLLFVIILAMSDYGR